MSVPFVWIPKNTGEFLIFAREIRLSVALKNAFPASSGSPP